MLKNDSQQTEMYFAAPMAAGKVSYGTLTSRESNAAKYFTET